MVCFFSVLLLAVIIISAYRERAPEWKQIQNEFKELVMKKFGPEQTANVNMGIHQIWIPELGRTDRCITCHMGMEWKGLEETDIPFASHPNPELIKKHPFNKYGCSICHGGQGYATKVNDAHGWVEERDWGKPLMAAYIAEDYLISEKTAAIQSNCNICHRYEKETEGMEFINQGKELVSSKGCKACHIINGTGGVIGPDLTYEGDKHPEEFGFSHITGYHSVYNWHMEHLKNAKSVVPTSIMPDFRFTSKERRSLAMLLMSWRSEAIPVEYLPGSGFKEIMSPEQIEREEAMMSGPGQIFVEKGCFTCHTISVFRVFSPTNLGPELSKAKEDVPIRFQGKNVEQFLKNPTGTMDFVLKTSQYKFKNDEERNTFVKKLNKAHDVAMEYEKKGMPLPTQ